MQSDIEIAGGLAVTALIFSTIAIMVAIFSDNSPDTSDGVTGHDLRLQVEICTPPGATWEQELACTQAVYGVLKVVAE